MKLLSRGVVAKPPALISSISSRASSGRPACSVRPGERRPPAGRRDLARQPLEDRRVRTQLAALVEERERDGAVELGVDRREQPAVRLLALPALEHLARDPRAALVVALQRGAHRAHAVAVEQQRGLLRGRGELGVAREVRVDLVEPAQLEQGGRAPDVRVGGAGDPVVRLRQLDQLGRELQPVRRAAGAPAGLQGAGQRRRERLGPAHPARHRDRLVGDRPHLGLGDLREEAAVDRDPGEHLRAHRASPPRAAVAAPPRAARRSRCPRRRTAPRCRRRARAPRGRRPPRPRRRGRRPRRGRSSRAPPPTGRRRPGRRPARSRAGRARPGRRARRGAAARSRRPAAATASS